MVLLFILLLLVHVASNNLVMSSYDYGYFDYQFMIFIKPKKKKIVQASKQARARRRERENLSESGKWMDQEEVEVAAWNRFYQTTSSGGLSVSVPLAGLRLLSTL